MEIKTCSQCQLPKLIDQFNWKTKSKGIRHSACKDCSRAQGKAHYKANSKSVISKTVKRNASYWKINQEWKKNLHCVFCNEDYFRCLEFHHLNSSEKEFALSTRFRNASPQAILKEAEKCIVLCANCHRKVHGNVLAIKPQHIVVNRNMIQNTYNALVHPLASNQLKG